MTHPVVASTKCELKYAQPLDAVDAGQAGSSASPKECGLRRRRPLEDAGKQPWHWDIPLVVVLGILLAALVVTRAIGVFLYAAGGV